MAEESDDAKLHFLDYWRVIRSRKEVILAVVLLVTLTGIAYTVALPNIYRASTRIEVREDLPDEPVFRQEYGSTYNPYFLRTQYQKIQSRTAVLYEVIKALGLQQKWGDKFNKGQMLSLEVAGDLLSKCIRVEQFKDTTLIDIQVFREDADEARDIANEIARIYMDQRRAAVNKKQKESQESFDNEVTKQQEEVEKADALVASIQKTNRIIMIGPRSGLTLDGQHLQDLQAQSVSARIDMLTRKARWDKVVNLDGDELIAQSTFLVTDPTLQGLRKQLMDNEVQLKTLLQNYGKMHPEVKQTQAAVDELKEKLSKNLNGVKQGIQADYDVSKTRYDAITNELNMAMSVDTQVDREKLAMLEKAQKEAQAKRDILVSLQARQKERETEIKAPHTPVEIVEFAEKPSRPVSPNIMLNIFLSLFLGLGAGIGLAYFIEYLDTSVKTVDDVERYLGLPVLGVIPQKVRPLSEQGPESPHAEAYRVLRTNMQFANKGQHGGAFSVVSGGVSEGKSTTLFNLSYVCAQLGDKVLVVDSDLRRPVQHTFFGMSNRFGLTNVLMRDVPIEETIKATSIPNLHFLPSGKLPRSSLGLLDSQRMRELVKNLKARYDYVFFDSPPIVGVSDASILASEVDGVLLIVQYRKYPRSISLRARRMLENVGANVVGVVLNNINILRDDYYYYYHSYYSHYDRSEESVPPGELSGTDQDSGKKEENF